LPKTGPFSLVVFAGGGDRQIPKTAFVQALAQRSTLSKGDCAGTKREPKTPATTSDVETGAHAAPVAVDDPVLATQRPIKPKRRRPSGKARTSSYCDNRTGGQEGVLPLVTRKWGLDIIQTISQTGFCGLPTRGSFPSSARITSLRGSEPREELVLTLLFSQLLGGFVSGFSASRWVRVSGVWAAHHYDRTQTASRLRATPQTGLRHPETASGGNWQVSGTRAGHNDGSDRRDPVNHIKPDLSAVRRGVMLRALHGLRPGEAGVKPMKHGVAPDKTFPGIGHSSMGSSAG